MLRVGAGIVLALAMTASCSKGAPATAPSGGAASGALPISGAVKADDFNSKLPLKDVMGHVIDYAAFGIWENQGWIIDAQGEHELFPQDDAGWLQVESAALTLAEATNLLLLPGRPQDDKRDWIDHVKALRAAAMKAHDLAVKRDKQAFFDAGGEIYQACTDCHAQYVVGQESIPTAKLPDFSPTGIRPKPN